MTREEIATALRDVEGRRARVTFDDGTILLVEIHSVDDEGFLHTADGEDPPGYWTMFESVRSIEPVNS
jgi:hypothetical protein